MKTFAELLTYHIKRAGITDTELARAIRVSRQTIFRWREGLTTRPNNRDDVIVIANKLRLSAKERDELLMAGGFRPDDIDEKNINTADHNKKTDYKGLSNIFIKVAESPENKSILHVLTKLRESIPVSRRNIYYFSSLALVVLTIVILVVINLPEKIPDIDKLSINQTTSPPFNPDVITTALPGETLVLVSQIDTTDTGSITENLISSIQRESKNNRLTNIRVEKLPISVSDDNQASQIQQDYKASIIIYRELVQNDIKVHIQTESDKIADVLLQTPVNSIEINILSMIVLGQICINIGNTEQAYYFLSKAHTTIIDNSIENDAFSLLVNRLLNTNNP